MTKSTRRRKEYIILCAFLAPLASAVKKTLRRRSGFRFQGVDPHSDLQRFSLRYLWHGRHRGFVFRPVFGFGIVDELNDPFVAVLAFGDVDKGRAYLALRYLMAGGTGVFYQQWFDL